MNAMDAREFDDPERIDVFSFRAVERLRVHEARTLAEVQSGVVRHATVLAVGPRRLAAASQSVSSANPSARCRVVGGANPPAATKL